MRDFLPSDAQALLNDGGRIGTPFSEALFQYFQGGRRQKDRDERSLQFGVFFGPLPNGGGALHVHVEQHILTLPQFAQDFPLESSIAVAVNSGVLEKIARLHALKERVCVQKEIIDPVLLAFSRWTGRAGDRAGHLASRRQQLLA